MYFSQLSLEFEKKKKKKKNICICLLPENESSLNLLLLPPKPSSARTEIQRGKPRWQDRFHLLQLMGVEEPVLSKRITHVGWTDGKPRRGRGRRAGGRRRLRVQSLLTD